MGGRARVQSPPLLQGQSPTAGGGLLCKLEGSPKPRGPEGWGGNCRGRGGRGKVHAVADAQEGRWQSLEPESGQGRGTGTAGQARPAFPHLHLCT